MRIVSIHAEAIPPIRKIEVTGLSDVVVFAGPNGVGKTRFIGWLLQFFQSLDSRPDQWIEVEATSAEEIAAWGNARLDTRNAADAEKLRVHLRKNRRRAAQVSSVLNFESDRSIKEITPYSFSWDATDPFEELISWKSGFNALSSRFTDTIHSLFRKVRSRRETIALTVEKLFKEAEANTAQTDKAISVNADDFPDPLAPFKNAFSQLLAPKRLVDPEAVKQQLHFADANGEEYPILSLSSGEREVVNVVFDFLLRNPSDCIVVFDEPELHLHPELSYKLLQTLRTAGARNQFIFCTHSADIISASLDNSVVFISPPKEDGSNQAVIVREDDDTHRALKLLGQSIGIVALGKKIVLIEGDQGSLDKQTYGAILKSKFPNLVLVPSGGKGLIQSFGAVLERVIEKSIWGVQFFMLCDRDAVPTSDAASRLEASAKGRVRVLNRYHLENYFLDETIIAKIFQPFVAEDSWLRDPAKVGAKLLEIAKSRLSHATALIVAARYRETAGNVSIQPKDCHGKTLDELSAMLKQSAESEAIRITQTLQAGDVEEFTRETYAALEASLVDGSWKIAMPGRPILSIFCSSKMANFDFGRFKIAYLRAASEVIPSPFEEIEDYFEGFSRL